ncbi:unnamed protein product [Victoria cruziana]
MPRIAVGVLRSPMSTANPFQHTPSGKGKKSSGEITLAPKICVGKKLFPATTSEKVANFPNKESPSVHRSSW